jgi:hypothetical protein
VQWRYQAHYETRYEEHDEARYEVRFVASKDELYEARY